MDAPVTIPTEARNKTQTRTAGRRTGIRRHQRTPTRQIEATEASNLVLFMPLPRFRYLMPECFDEEIRKKYEADFRNRLVSIIHETGTGFSRNAGSRVR
ncbi:phage minor capsid protein [Streptomyces sp. NBRC 110611]|nr:phage minor capsid protein [Streptomyces sp. NBRC 110611]